MNAATLVLVEYTDAEGLRTMRRVPADMYKEDWGMGILVGPPPLDTLGLPERIQTKLNNELVNRRLITYADVRKRPQDLFAALQATFKTDVQTLQRLFHEFEGG